MTGSLNMTNQEIIWSENTDAARIGFYNVAGQDESYMYFKTQDNGNEYFRWLHKDYRESSDQEWMRLKPSGLTVKGNIYADGTSYFGAGKKIIDFADTWIRLNPTSAFAAGIYCGNKVLRTDGQFEVGEFGLKFKVTSAGTVTAAGSITSAGDITAFSDRALKTNIQPINDGFLAKINQLQPSSYQWKDESKSQRTQMGFIAQDVKELFPEWVHENDEHLSLAYDKMGAVLAVKGIQELHAEIAELKETIKELQNGVTK
ncbi:MAG: tail fiber domain-containing protein [Bacteroidota bacterium]